MYILYLAEMKERDLSWKGQTRMVQDEITPNSISFYKTKKVSPLVKFE